MIRNSLTEMHMLLIKSYVDKLLETDNFFGDEYAHESEISLDYYPCYDSYSIRIDIRKTKIEAMLGGDGK